MEDSDNSSGSIVKSDVAVVSAESETKGVIIVSMNGDRNAICHHCGRQFASGSHRNAHVRRMHSGAHKCAECEATFDTYNELRKHTSVEHPRIHKCSICNYSHRLAFQVKRHQKQSHGDHAIACAFSGCTALLPYRQLLHHMRNVHAVATESNDDSCTPVNALVARRVESERQSRIRSQAHKFFENNVGDIPNNFKGLSTASKADADFQCAACGQRRETRARLRRHIARVHEKRYAERPREQRYPCTELNCVRIFNSAAKLEDHLNVHRGIRPYECLRCSRSFVAKAEYARHLRKYHKTTIRDVFNQAEIIDVVGSLPLDDITAKSRAD